MLDRRVLALEIALSLAGLPPASGEEARIEFGHLTADDGLSRNWVQCVLKDSRGFLWVGTQNGLNRYDGARFTVYRHSPGDPSSLPSNVVGGLYEDRKGRLWVGSGWGRAGMALYDRDHDRFVRIPFGPGSGGLSGSWVHAILEDRSGRLWVGTESGLDLVDVDKGLFRSHPFSPPRAEGDTASVIFSLFEDRDGRLWVGTGSGLFRFDPETGAFTAWPGRADHPNGPDRADVWDILQTEDGSLWVATIGGGLYQLDPATGAQRRYAPRAGDPASLSHLRVRRLARDRQGRIWVGTENGGLNLLDPATGRFRRLLPAFEDEHSLNSTSIWALYVDDQGIVWIGTYNGGLNYVLPKASGFDLIKVRKGGLSNPHVTAVIEDRRGDLWIGTDGGGLNRMERPSGRFTHYRHDPGDPATIGADAVFGLLEDRDGSIWVGGWDGGLGRLDPATGRVTRFRHDPGDPRTIVSDSVWKVLALRSGELLIATPDGVDLLDRQRRTFTRLSALYPEVGQLSTSTAVEDVGGNLWLGRRIDGAQHVDRASGTVTTYRHDPADPQSLGVGWVMAIHIDRRGNVWLGTEGGLNCLPAGSRRLRRFSVADGLPHDNVASILEDEAGSLWLGTLRGLSQFVGAVDLPAEPQFFNYTVHDGLQGQEFGQDAAYRSPSGWLYVGGERGLNAFRPEAVRRNLEPPPVVLTDLRIFNHSAVPGAPGSPLARAITETRELRLSPAQSVLTFEFAALNFLLPQKNQYAYRLEGFDPDWNWVKDQRTANYTNLPAGRYTLRVRASNNDGVWNEEGVTLGIEVLPRWYERRSIQLAAAFLLAGAVTGAFRWRLRQLRRRERELESRVEERTADLQRLNEELEDRVESRTAELAAEKERLAVTLRSIADGVIATDVEGRVVLMNRVAEQMTGWTLAEAQGAALSTVLQVVDRETRRPQPDLVAAVLAGGRVLELPVQSLLLRRDGREALIADSAAPIRDRESRIVGVVIVFRDVTERRRVEEQLQTTQRLEALGILAGGIAHDFNNLLMGIFGYMEVAQKHSDAPSKTRDSLSKALAVLERARGLTGQLLTFSRAGQPVTQPLALPSLLRNSARFVLSGSNVECAMDVADDLWPCQGDEQQIGQVVDNLLLNARQAMPEGGMIHVVARNAVVPDEARPPVAEGRYVQVTVRDEGPGIPPDLHARIFEPFFTTKAKGSGLGLATAYSIVRKHGGHIAVTSAPGHGASFTAYLPAATEAAAGRPESAPALAPGVGKILVLDDEEYVRDVVSEMLTEAGYAVETVSSGERAVEAYRNARSSSAPFDLVILDLTIPGGTGGTATLARLQQIEPTVRAIASSGYSGDPVMAEPAAHGFASCLVKPYTTAELLETVARALAQRSPR